MSSVPEGFDVKTLKDRNYKGEDFNIKTELGAGPFAERRCTDIFCCLIFTVFLGAMGFCSGYGYMYGHPDKLLSPIGGDGNICGVSPGFEDYPYLFIADINEALKDSTNLFKFGACVKSCPKTAQENIQCKTTKYVKSCNLDKSDKYGTTYFFEYCMPVYETLDPAVQRQWSTLNQKFTDSKSGSVIMDLFDAKWVILGGVGITIVLTLIYIKFMDKCADIIAWASVWLLFFFIVASGAITWYYASKVDHDDDPNNDYGTHLFYLAFFLWILGFLFLLFICCAWNSLKVSIAIIETAADWFADTKRILFVPVFYFFVGLVIIAVWLVGMVGIHSIGDITVESVRAQNKNVVHST